MKSILTIILFLFSINLYPQQQALHITPAQISEHIKSTKNKKTVLQFWNPNCKEVEDILKQYKAAEAMHNDTDFYFIAITSKDTLITNAIKDNNYPYKLYVADAAVNPDLYERMASFCKKMCALLNIKKSEFLTMYLDKNDKVIYAGDAAYNEIEKIMNIK